jgi:hypothetical protein
LILAKITPTDQLFYWTKTEKFFSSVGFQKSYKENELWVKTLVLAVLMVFRIPFMPKHKEKYLVFNDVFASNGAVVIEQLYRGFTILEMNRITISNYFV